MTTISNNLDQLVIARRLMLHAQRAEDRRLGKIVDEKTAKEEADEDQALLSGTAPSEGTGTQNAAPKTEDRQINLSELFARLKELENQPVANNGMQPTANDAQAVQVNVQTVVERTASLRYAVLEKVDGLVRNSQTQAETDRYRFDFSDGSTFKITDKWNNRSTTVWGDPHVDVDDVEGTSDGDFQDMKGSNSHTTMMLQDGTRLTFTAKDNGVIEAVDIFKGNQHLGGIGSASNQWNEKNGLFAAKVDDSAGKSSAVPQGDTVYAGGDGNDWFTADGKLLWGKTTGTAINSRPYAVMQMEYRETISQQVTMQAVNKQV